MVVANSFMRVPQDPMIERVIVGDGMDAADDWIAERARTRADIVVTADIRSASRSIRPARRRSRRTGGRSPRPISA